MSIRRVFFWSHLIAGSIGGIVILLMSVTGVLLTYEKQITAWSARDLRVTVPAGASRLGAEELLAKAREQKDAMPQTLAIKSDPTEPVSVGYGRESTLYLNPYTGASLGEGSTKVRAFFQSVTSWHRWLGAEGQGPGRDTARMITGACNFAFLFLVVSGAYLWLPRKWSWNSVRAVSIFRSGLSGKARDFNWHNVTGVWCFAPLLLIVASGVVMSYPWASNLVYTMAGSKPPEQGQGGGGRDGGGKGGGRDGGGKGGDRQQADRPRGDVSFEGLNQQWALAEQAQTGWQSISLRIPASNRAPLAFTIDQSNGGQPQKRATLTIDRKTGAAPLETFTSQDIGRQWRTWMRFTHTGEYYGLIGQTVAGIASLGGALLVWTGLSLALRRLRSYLGRRKAKVGEEVPVPVGAASGN